MDTNSYILNFNAPKPHEIKVGYIKIKFEIYFPKPLRSLDTIKIDALDPQYVEDAAKTTQNTWTTVKKRHSALIAKKIILQILKIVKSGKGEEIYPK